MSYNQLDRAGQELIKRISKGRPISDNLELMSIFTPLFINDCIKQGIIAKGPNWVLEIKNDDQNRK